MWKSMLSFSEWYHKEKNAYEIVSKWKQGLLNEYDQQANNTKASTVESALYQ